MKLWQNVLRIGERVVWHVPMQLFFVKCPHKILIWRQWFKKKIELQNHVIKIIFGSHFSKILSVGILLDMFICQFFSMKVAPKYDNQILLFFFFVFFCHTYSQPQSPSSSPATRLLLVLVRVLLGEIMRARTLV